MNSTFCHPFEDRLTARSEHRAVPTAAEVVRLTEQELAKADEIEAALRAVPGPLPSADRVGRRPGPHPDFGYPHYPQESSPPPRTSPPLPPPRSCGSLDAATASLRVDFSVRQLVHRFAASSKDLTEGTGPPRTGWSLSERGEEVAAAAARSRSAIQEAEPAV